MEMVVQINGKLRSRIMMPKSASKDEMIAAAKADEKSKVWLDGKTIVKEIAIPGKLVNFVVKEAHPHHKTGPQDNACPVFVCLPKTSKTSFRQ